MRVSGIVVITQVKQTVRQKHVGRWLQSHLFHELKQTLRTPQKDVPAVGGVETKVGKKIWQIRISGFSQFFKNTKGIFLLQFRCGP